MVSVFVHLKGRMFYVCLCSFFFCQEVGCLTNLLMLKLLYLILISISVTMSCLSVVVATGGDLLTLVKSQPVMTVIVRLCFCGACYTSHPCHNVVFKF